MKNPDDNPYIGPRKYEREEGHLFFGRELDARELLSLVVSERLVLFYAQSGAGKSSLINTRLIPGLENKGFEVLPVGRVVSRELPVQIETDNIFITNLLLNLDQSDREPERFTQMKLADFLADLTIVGEHYYYESQSQEPDSQEDEEVAQIWPRALIIDQFEEIFTTYLEAWQKREDFFRQLNEAMQADPYLWVVLVMREDYIASIDPYTHLLPGSLRWRYYMQRLGPEAALDAIKGPARGRRDYDEGVAEKLVDELRQIIVVQPDGHPTPFPGAYVEPVQLQVVCYQLWENLPPGEASISAEDVAKVGDVGKSLAIYYAGRVAAVASELKIRERVIREWFDTKLITESGLRGLVLEGSTSSAGLDNQAIYLLQNAHLVRAEKRAATTWYELAHDRLVEPIRENNAAWFEEHLSLLQQQAAIWDKEGQLDGLLLDGEALIEAEKELEDIILSATEDRFLQASRERRKRVLLEKERAETAQKLAEAEKQRAEAAVQLSQEQAARLDAAQALADEQAKRAAEQAKAATGLRRQRSFLGLALVIAIVATVFAVISARVARENEAKAETQKAVAEIQKAAVETQRSVAETQEALALTAKADAQLSADVAISAQETAEVLQQQAEEISILNQLRQVEAQASLWLNDQLDVALLLSLEAYRLLGEEALDTMFTALQYNPRLITHVEAHSESVVEVEISPDGKILTAAGQDTIHLWDITDVDHPELITELLTGHTERLYSLAISPDGKTLASGSRDETIRLWDISDPSQLVTLGEPLTGHTSSVRSVAFGPDGNVLASGSWDGTIRLWDISDPYQPSTKGTIEFVERYLNDVAISPDGSLLASAGYFFDDVRLWDISDPANPEDIGGTPEQGSTSYMYRVTFSPDGQLLASGDLNGFVYLWDVSTPEKPVLLGDPLEMYTVSVAISQDGSKLATGGTDGEIQLWDISDPAKPASLGEPYTGHAAYVYGVAFSLDGKTLFSGGWDDKIRIWKVEEANQTVSLGRPLLDETSTIDDLEFSPDGKILASAGGRDIHLWETSDPDHFTELGDALDCDSRSVSSLAFNPSGNILAAGNTSGTICLWDTSDPNQIDLINNELSSSLDIDIIEFSRDGNMLVTVDQFDKTIQFWDVSDPYQPVSLGDLQTGHESSVYTVAFSTDGKYLASGSSDYTILIWDISDPENPRAVGEPLAYHALTVESLDFHPSDNIMASGGLDGIRLWEMTNPAKPVTLGKIPGFNTYHVTFSTDGRLLASGGGNGSVRLWDVSTPRNPIPFGPPLIGHNDTVQSVAFSPDGQFLVTGDYEGVILVWDLRVEKWMELVCDRAGRSNLTREEWAQYLPEQAYHQSCTK